MGCCGGGGGSGGTEGNLGLAVKVLAAVAVIVGIFLIFR